MRGLSCARLAAALVVMVSPARADIADDDAWLFDQLNQLGRSRNDTQWEKGEPNEFPHHRLAKLKKLNAASVQKMNPSRKFAARKGHVEFCEWLSRHHPYRADLREKLMIRASDRLALWPSRWQWSEAFHEKIGVSSAPHFPQEQLRERWPVLADQVATLQSGIVSSFIEEHDQVLTSKASRPSEHPEGIHVTGTWTVLYLMDGRGSCKKDQFPRSCAILESFDNAIRSAGQGRINAARFASLHPGTKVVPHTATSNQRLKVHCGIANPDGVQLRIADLSLEWKRGECLVIDDSFEHELESKPNQRVRTILELKIEHPDLRSSGFSVSEETGKLISDDRAFDEL